MYAPVYYIFGKIGTILGVGVFYNKGKTLLGKLPKGRPFACPKMPQSFSL